MNRNTSILSAEDVHRIGILFLERRGEASVSCFYNSEKRVTLQHETPESFGALIEWYMLERRAPFTTGTEVLKEWHANSIIFLEQSGIRLEQVFNSVKSQRIAQYLRKCFFTQNDAKHCADGYGITFESVSNAFRSLNEIVTIAQTLGDDFLFVWAPSIRDDIEGGN